MQSLDAFMAIRNILAEVEEIKKGLENLGCAELEAERSANPGLLLLDIREIQERVDLGTIPGSKHAPRGMLEFWADPESPYYRDWFEEGRRTVLFCAGGARSALAARALLDMGFRDVAHLEGGFKEWKESERSVEDVSATSRWVRRERS